MTNATIFDDPRVTEYLGKNPTQHNLENLKAVVRTIANENGLQVDNVKINLDSIEVILTVPATAFTDNAQQPKRHSYMSGEYFMDGEAYLGK